ncbi:MAG: PAS domain S-box protein [Desulfomonile tiedjei]|nr:PAS domain S-box protein [Desulfomonile tiedjei]
MIDKEIEVSSTPEHVMCAEPLPDETELCTQTVDLDQWFSSDLTSSGSFDLGILAIEAFGKLLDALPIPTLLVDGSYSVVFVNRACGKISPNYDKVRGVPFATLVPRPRNAEKAQLLLRRVFSTRKPHVADGILEFETKKVWGRLHFSSIRIGRDRYTMILVEDLTSERTQLLLNQRDWKQIRRKLEELEKLASDSSEERMATADRLEKELTRHERTRESLRDARRKFDALTEQIPFGVAVIDTEGGFRYLNGKFKELFGWHSESLPHGTEWFTRILPETDRTYGTVLEWLEAISVNDGRERELRTFEVVLREGDRITVAFRSVKLPDGDYLVTCKPLPPSTAELVPSDPL